MSTVEVLTEVGAVAVLVLKLIAPCWGQIGPLTKVPFSLFERTITSLTSPVCNRMACPPTLSSVARIQHTVPPEQQDKQKRKERQNRPLYLAVQTVIME